MSKIVNLTPHTINLYVGETLVQSIPSTGLARAKATSVQIGEVNGFPIYRTSYGTVEGLPAAQDDTVYIVSALAAQAVPERADVLIVSDTVRNDSGQIVGCRGFAHV